MAARVAAATTVAAAAVHCPSIPCSSGKQKSGHAVRQGNREARLAKQQQQQQERNAYLPQRKAEPVGPHILWPAPTIQSAPSCWTSIGLQGTDWQQSSSSLAPTCRAHTPCESTTECDETVQCGAAQQDLCEHTLLCHVHKSVHTSLVTQA